MPNMKEDFPPKEPRPVNVSITDKDVSNLKSDLNASVAASKTTIKENIQQVPENSFFNANVSDGPNVTSKMSAPSSNCGPKMYKGACARKSPLKGVVSLSSKRKKMVDSSASIGLDKKYKSEVLAITDCTLHDLGLVGPPFMWNNHHRGIGNVQKQIDIMFAMMDWSTSFLTAKVF
ncbi:hypothetical protein ACOSQ3_028928 [Xanthoceras sorbifolium]